MGKCKSIGKDKAIELYKSMWWIGKTDKEVARFQLSTEELCCPFEIFHRSVESALGRPVWSHEFANMESLFEELNA